MASLRTPTRWLFLLLLAAGSTGLLACHPSDTAQPLDVTNPRLVQTSPGQRSFSATLVNHEDAPISFAAVEVAFYDGSGSKVETTQIGVQDIPARGTVDFSGRIDSDRSFRQAQVQSILTP